MTTTLEKTGIIILIVGLLMTLYTGITYFTREKVVDLGEREITKDNQNTVNWQPYIGIGLMIIGGVVLVLGVNRKDEKEINDSLRQTHKRKEPS
jgi:uncharacterized membrane protein YidH (DUF202 family)